jgi:hypothetical protein
MHFARLTGYMFHPSPPRFDHTNNNDDDDDDDDDDDNDDHNNNNNTVMKQSRDSSVG